MIRISIFLAVFAVVAATGFLFADPDDSIITSKIAVKATFQGNPIGIDIGDGLTMEFIRINAGSFRMGSPESDPDADFDEKPQRTVIISKAFYMGKYEVTQAQYQKIMGKYPPNTATYTNLPVSQITWSEAVEFCNRLSINQGLMPCYKKDPRGDVTCNWSANGYRLPTEAEWEYCCRAGTTTIFTCGDKFNDIYNQYYLNHLHDAHNEIAEKVPNPWGLYDINGSVWEWCWDCYDSRYYSKNETLDPRGPSKGVYRILRGGGMWVSNPRRLRSGYRYFSTPIQSYATTGVGLRVIRHQ